MSRVRLRPDDLTAWEPLTPAAGVTASGLEARINGSRVEVRALSLVKTTSTGPTVSLRSGLRPTVNTCVPVVGESGAMVVASIYATGGVYLRPGPYELANLTFSFPLG